MKNPWLIYNFVTLTLDKENVFSLFSRAFSEQIKNNFHKKDGHR